MSLTVLSLCSGYGGLDLAVEAVFDAVTIAHAEFEDAPSAVLAVRWPSVPNLGDITRIDWSGVKADIITAGYPCQPFSLGGHRKGAKDARHLWPDVAEAIRRVRPRYVVLENVAGHRSLGLDAVLGDLAALGYDAVWTSLRAADVGATHGRERIFILAADTRGEAVRLRPGLRAGGPLGERRGRPDDDGASDAAADPARGGRRTTRRDHGVRAEGLVQVAAADTNDYAARTGREGGLSTGRRPEPAQHDRDDSNEYDCPGCGDLLGEHHYPGDTCPPADSDVAGSQSSEPAAGRLMPARGAVTDAQRGGCSGRAPDEVRSAGRRTAAARSGQGDDGWPLADAESDRRDERRTEPEGLIRGSDVAECSDATAPDADRDALRNESVAEPGRSGPAVAPDAVQWGQYEPAIRRWERVLGRVAPAPTDAGPKGGQRLSPLFVEWMMGLPAGWVTDVPGLSRNAQLKMLGNGVVPQQAIEALRRMLPVLESLGGAA